MQTASNGLTEDAHSLSQSAVGKVTSLFKSGKRRRAGDVDGAAEGGNGAGATYTTESPFSEAQTDWLADVVGESIQHSISEFGMKFASKIEQRFIEAERRIDALEQAADTSAQKINDLEAMVQQLLEKVNVMEAKGADAVLNDRVAEMAVTLQAQRTDLESVKASQTTNIHGGAQAGDSRRHSIAASSSETPYEARTTAVLMNLLPPAKHNDLTSEDDKRARQQQCYEAGKALLLELQIVPETFSELVGMRSGKGCNLTFTTHGALQMARSKVMNANKSYGMLDGKAIKVFLDCAKTRNEMRPALLTHRAFDVVVDIEKEQSNPQQVTKDMRGKTVKVGNNRAGYSLHGSWYFTALAHNRYSESDIQMALAYSNMY